MARPERNTVDYFPFYCDEGEKMFYIEQTYGNDGFATFIKILRELSKKDYHYLNLQDEPSKMFLSAKCKVSKEVLISIINDLVNFGKFDAELWDNSIIWCQDFIDSIQDAYKKRNNKCIDRNSLLLLLDSKGVLKPSKSNPKPSKCILKVAVNPQRKEKDTIEENTIVNDIIDYLNLKAGTKFKSGSRKTKELIQARQNEGYKLEDFKKVIEVKCSKWLNDPKMKAYLRPETLFGTKFESYLNENITPVRREGALKSGMIL